MLSIFLSFVLFFQGNTFDESLMSKNVLAGTEFRCRGGDSCCRNRNCGLGEGDCDRNSDCKSGLWCGSNNCRTLAYFRGWSTRSFDRSDDCCTHCLGGDSCCNNRKCGMGEGDCDSNSHCARGYFCGTNNCRRVGYYLGYSRPWKLFESDDDCCTNKCLGGDNCCKGRKCGMGEGDCDNNGECAPGLFCGVNNCRTVGRHLGWRNVDKYFQSGDDCCSNKCVGGDSCCNRRTCGLGEGDCDSDNQCAGSLLCRKDNCRTLALHLGWRKDSFQVGDDCCSDGCYGGDGCCRPSQKCGFAQGDCDSNNDCKGSLVCNNNLNNCRSLAKNMGWRLSSFQSGDDCCTHPKCIIAGANSCNITPLSVNSAKMNHVWHYAKRGAQVALAIGQIAMAASGNPAFAATLGLVGQLLNFGDKPVDANRIKNEIKGLIDTQVRALQRCISQAVSQAKADVFRVLVNQVAVKLSDIHPDDGDLQILSEWDTVWEQCKSNKAIFVQTHSESLDYFNNMTPLLLHINLCMSVAAQYSLRINLYNKEKNGCRNIRNWRDKIRRGCSQYGSYCRNGKVIKKIPRKFTPKSRINAMVACCSCGGGVAKSGSNSWRKNQGDLDRELESILSVGKSYLSNGRAAIVNYYKNFCYLDKNNFNKIIKKFDEQFTKHLSPIFSVVEEVNLAKIYIKYKKIFAVFGGILALGSVAFWNWKRRSNSVKYLNIEENL